ncbi:EAL domain-containing protein [Propionivibrio sp.]|uniref:EAL and HDOD domain-containing protein n=1 Tax=Propionivibrio sp. TaxID=2212460 RepID=UPI00261AEF10|nr:EAL domain-containing protein [Propionivibrio sp.]
MPNNEQLEVFLGRQPILDRNQQLFAYKLLFRDGPLATGNRADILDPTQATATVIANTFTELATNNALGPYRGFISIDHELLFSDLIEALPPQLAAFEILDTVAPTTEVVARCQQLHEHGFTLVIDDIEDISADYLPLLALVDIIKVDIMKMDADRLRVVVAQFIPFGKKLLAEKVETIEQFSLCHSLGFDLFQGYFFARPTIIVGKKLNPSQLSLIRLLGLILEDAETDAIENAFKLEPGLTVNMLRLTNSVSCSLATKITSLRHAITILGRRQLQRWLQLLIYTDPKGATQDTPPLLQLAATRGRLMELLADREHARNREFSDQAFMVGIISLMPALIGMAMEDIVEQLPVALRVKQALTGYGGAHGQLLRLVEATEQTDPVVLEEALHGHPAINMDFLGNCLTQALSWANHLGQEQA